MDRQRWFELYKLQPDLVQNYLLSQTAAQNESAAQTKLGLENDAWDRVMDVVWELLFEKLNALEWQQRLKGLVADQPVEDTEKALLFHVVLPLADIVPWDVEARLMELGVRAADMQSVVRVSLRPVSYGAAARRIAGLARLSILSEDLVTRLRDMLVSYIKGVRTLDQLQEVLVRLQAEGGMGLSQEQVKQFLKVMQEFLDGTQVMSETEYSDWFTRYQRDIEQQKLETELQLKRAKETATSNDELAPARAGLVDRNSVLDQGIVMAKERIGELGLDEYLLRRLENAISTRLRDVRNLIQVKQILSRDVKVGGVGLSAEQAEKIGDLIEAVYNEQHVLIEGEEQKRLSQTRIDQDVKIEERKKRESEEHAKWFEEKVKNTALAAVMQVPGGSNPFGAPLQAGVARMRLDGVVPPTRMMGVEEELGSMTWNSFRLLSKDPMQAGNKVMQKLDALKTESFDRWTRGLAAWRQSPLSQSYLRLVAESFAAGKPVAELVEEKRLTDMSLPTAEELGAVISLNSRLQA